MMDYPLLNDTLLGVTLFPHESIVPGLKSQLLSALGGPLERWVGHWVETCLCVFPSGRRRTDESSPLATAACSSASFIRCLSPLERSLDAEYRLPTASNFCSQNLFFLLKVSDSSQVQREKMVLDWVSF